jgi:transposase
LEARAAGEWEEGLSGMGQRRAEESRVAELERKIGQQALEIDFLRRCLQRVEEQRKLQALTGRLLSTSRSSKK